MKTAILLLILSCAVGSFAQMEVCDSKLLSKIFVDTLTSLLKLLESVPLEFDEGIDIPPFEVSFLTVDLNIPYLEILNVFKLETRKPNTKVELKEDGFKFYLGANFVDGLEAMAELGIKVMSSEKLIVDEKGQFTLKTAGAFEADANIAFDFDVSPFELRATSFKIVIKFPKFEGNLELTEKDSDNCLDQFVGEQIVNLLNDVTTKEADKLNEIISNELEKIILKALNELLQSKEKLINFRLLLKDKEWLKNGFVNYGSEVMKIIMEFYKPKIMKFLTKIIPKHV